MELLKNSHSVTTESRSTPQVNRTSADILAHHLKRNTFKVGDKVVFKKPKRNRTYGVITNIETDPEKVTWIKGRTIPSYISVRSENRGSPGVFIQLKTYESKLVLDRRTYWYLYEYMIPRQGR